MKPLWVLAHGEEHGPIKVTMAMERFKVKALMSSPGTGSDPLLGEWESRTVAGLTLPGKEWWSSPVLRILSQLPGTTQTESVVSPVPGRLITEPASARHSSPFFAMAASCLHSQFPFSSLPQVHDSLHRSMVTLRRHTGVFYDESIAKPCGTQVVPSMPRDSPVKS